MIPKVLQAEELDQYWPFIRSGLEDILSKDPDQDWVTDGVYRALKIGRSSCVLGIKDENPVGFFVGYVMTDMSFFAWVGWCKEDTDDGVAILDWYAKSLNCKKIKFATERNGWNVVARKYGYKPTVWVKEL